MGYILKDIANITEPARISLSGLPNFIRLASKTVGGTRYQVRVVPTSPSAITVTVQDGEGGIRVLTGTTDPEAVEGSVFFIAADPLETAENLKAALLNNAYISANYDVYADIAWSGGAPTVNGVVIQAKDMGAEFNLTVTGAGAAVTAITTGTVNDTIRGSEPVVEVAVDLYKEDASQYIRTTPPAGSLGAPIITLSKSYNGLPIWFDLNGIAAQNLVFTPPTANTGVWFDTGTLVAYRALVRKGNYTQTPIYISEVLYALTGYGQLEDPREMLPYAYTAAPVQTLTEKPTTPYVLGQREYITFLLGAPLVGKTIGILQRAYNGAGAYLGGQTIATTATSSLHGVNSCAFDFNDLLAAYPAAVKVSATLVLNGAVISQPQEYDVRPDCLHIQNEFYFLNRLGGWDTFNFDAATSEENKPTGETFLRTVTPDYAAAQGVEGTYLADVETVKTVQGAPVGEDVAEWLKQLLAAKVIIDMEGRRVLIEDFTLRTTAGDFVAPVIKYRLSETYTNGY